MKKYLFLAVAVAIFLPTLVKAQPDENITKRRPDKPAQGQIQEIRQDARINHATRLVKRFDFYYKRFAGIITRFEARLVILKAGDKDIGGTQAKLDLAKAKLAEAKKASDIAIVAFKALDSTKFAQQKTERLAARDLAKVALKLFRDTHTLLKEALKELKTISKPALPTASAAVQNAQ
ncbi:hypothetical protein COT87_03205 [Candidatus Collierbacteria bacterium CG10_big_fil_rev_8_21_14_0_10_44_9]|uniref:DUF5667 domain-containing protein n=1 Tax=Candidatus Collierbacteria bacterium CG10_big_fil_rev_8_21_14_0_10_44_9 TaxID=1974535 RepID=A0A2H0VI22_9BACT|nr:MAG: hypothetical protein COT87_03205 [Candidatus Collierbacteria bacterium CG10_big_fil_rev_8_21_14_0_10_44_9]